MRTALLLATLAFGVTLWSADALKSVLPSYSAAGIVNSATNTTEALAPNAIATIYGADLSYDTGWRSRDSSWNCGQPVLRLSETNQFPGPQQPSTRRRDALDCARGHGWAA